MKNHLKYNNRPKKRELKIINKFIDEPGKDANKEEIEQMKMANHTRS